MAKISLNMNFARARELIHDQEFSYVLLEYDDLVSHRYLVSFYDDFTEKYEF